MRELAPGTDRYGAEVTVTGEGTWQFHVEAWSDPIAHWHHDAAIKMPRGQDVELMLTEGALLFERAARSIRQPPGAARPAAARDRADRARQKLRDRGLPPWDRLARRAAARDQGRARQVPAARPGHQVRRGCRCSWTGSGRSTGPGTSSSRAPRASSSTRWAAGAGVRDAAHRRAAARGGRRDGVRRRLPAAGPPDRHHLPQGARTTPWRPGPGDPGSPWAIGAAGRRPRRDPPGPRHVRRLRRVRGPGEASSAWRSRSTWRCRPRPTTPGSRSTPSGSPPGRRLHRLRREPAEEVPGHLPAELRQRPRGHLRRGAADRPATG